MFLPLACLMLHASDMVRRASFGSLFESSGLIGILLALAGLISIFLACRRWLELRSARLSPVELQRSLELKIRSQHVDAALHDATISKSFLGSVVAAGLSLRDGGASEMLAGVERATAKECLRYGNSIANLARWGGMILLAGFFGTGVGLINTLVMISMLKQPTVSDFVTGIGESLVSVSLAFFVSLVSFGAFFVLDSMLTRRALAVREIAEDIVRQSLEARPDRTA